VCKGSGTRIPFYSPTHYYTGVMADKLHAGLLYPGFVLFCFVFCFVLLCFVFYLLLCFVLFMLQSLSLAYVKPVKVLPVLVLLVLVPVLVLLAGSTASWYR
jgi:hypothetical protein